MNEMNLLKGKMVEHGYNIGSFARVLGISRQSLGKRFNGKSEFKSAEIIKARSALGIDLSDIGAYFFTEKVAKLETRQGT